jgi:hypothetical protein
VAAHKSNLIEMGGGKVNKNNELITYFLYIMEEIYGV